MVSAARTDKPFLRIAAKIRVAPEPARPILSAVKGSYRFQAMAVWFVLAAAALFSGCGGFSGSHSVSPASILLPGLLKVEPARLLAPGTSTNWVVSTATATRSVAMAAKDRVPAN